MRKNQVQKGNYVPYQRQTKRSPITLLLLITTLATTPPLAGCGSEKADTTSTESSYVETDETLETSAIVTSEEDTEEETKKEKSEPTHETDVDETEEETDEDDTDHTGTTTDNSKSADSKTGKSTQEQEAETAASTKAADTTTASSSTTAQTSGASKQTTAAQTTAATKQTAAPAQATTAAQITLTGIRASYTGGTKTEGASVTAAEISVTASYSDGSSKAVNGWSCDKANQSLPAGSHTFTVTYEGKSSSFTVNVQAAPTQATTQAPTQAEQPATSQAYIDEFMRGFNQARIDAGLPGNIGVNAKWSVYAQYYAEYMAKTFGSTGQEMTSDWHSDCLDWWPSVEGIGYAYSAYNAGYAQTEHVGAHQYEDYGDIGVGVYYYQGRYYVCVQQWESAEKGEVPFPNI